MPHGTVTATQARRQFSRLLREVQEGGSIAITRNGPLVAALVPVGGERRKVLAATLAQFDALAARGLPLDVAGGLDREALHRR